MTKKISIAIVAARAGSKRIKNKSFIKFNNERIVNLAINIGLTSKKIDYVVLTSDSKKILGLAKDNNKLIKLLRSEAISKDNSPMLPVIKDAIVKVEKITKKKTEKIIILDPTSVLRRKKDILKAINVFDTKKPSLLVSVNKSDFSPYFDIIEKKNKYFELCKKLNKKIYARQQAKHVYNINTVVWIYKRNSILFEKMRIPKTTIILETPEKFSLELNYPKDKIKMSNIKKYEKK